MTSRAPATASHPAELGALVTWAVSAARARAATAGVSEQAMVSAALHAVHGAVRSHHHAGAPLDAHVRRRVRGELLDEVKIERTRYRREPLLDDVEEADGETALSRAVGFEAMMLGSPEEALLACEAQAVLDREVERLPRDERRFYELYFRRELGHEKVALTLGISLRTVGYRAERIRARLTAAVRAYVEGG